MEERKRGMSKEGEREKLKEILASLSFQGGCLQHS